MAGRVRSVAMRANRAGLTDAPRPDSGKDHTKFRRQGGCSTWEFLVNPGRWMQARAYGTVSRNRADRVAQRRLACRRWRSWAALRAWDTGAWMSAILSHTATLKYSDIQTTSLFQSSQRYETTRRTATSRAP